MWAQHRCGASLPGGCTPHLTSSQWTLTGSTGHGDWQPGRSTGGFRGPNLLGPLVLPGQSHSRPTGPGTHTHLLTGATPLTTPGAFLLQDPKFSCGSLSSLVPNTRMLESIQTPGVCTVGLRCLASGKCPILVTAPGLKGVGLSCQTAL